jgi:shikimate kinase
LKELLKELRAGAGVKRIIALGGGAFARRQNAMLIEGSGIPTIFLDAGPEELWRRCREQVEQPNIERPLLGSLQSFQELYQARRPHYLKASFRQETGGKTVAEIATAIVQALGLGGSSGRRGEKL